MKKVLSIICAATILILSGCEKSNSLPGGDPKIVNSSGSGETESSVPTPSNITLQKISELREDLDKQINTVKNTKYNNLNTAEDLVVKIPGSDTLYDLMLTASAADFKIYYEKFDKTFDKEFAGIYTQEDKEKLYYVYDTNGEKLLLANHIDELMSGEMKFGELCVETEKAYLAMFSFGNGIYGLNHDGIIKRANPDETPTSVALTFAAKYFKVVKNYLDVDSEDKYMLLDKELSVKEAAEAAKKIVAENGYSWGGSLKPDVYQVKVLDIGDGKYGLSFTLTPSYKGVMFDAYEAPDDTSMNTYVQKKLDHNYGFYAPNSFMMESGKLDSLTGGRSEYSAAEITEYDSVIPFDQAAQIVSEAFGSGMDLSLSRADLLYSAMYPAKEDDNLVMAASPVWKFRCHNSVDDLKYIVYINAVNGNMEYYTCDWWEV